MGGSFVNGLIEGVGRKTTLTVKEILLELLKVASAKASFLVATVEKVTMHRETFSIGVQLPLQQMPTPMVSEYRSTQTASFVGTKSRMVSSSKARTLSLMGACIFHA